MGTEASKKPGVPVYLGFPKKKRIRVKGLNIDANSSNSSAAVDHWFVVYGHIRFELRYDEQMKNKLTIKQYYQSEYDGLILYGTGTASYNYVYGYGQQFIFTHPDYAKLHGPSSEQQNCHDFAMKMISFITGTTHGTGEARIIVSKNSSLISSKNESESFFYREKSIAAYEYYVSREDRIAFESFMEKLKEKKDEKIDLAEKKK